ncbi:MAG TPA: cellulase family glycosylhydrolase [Steroidobacteraceae bacterium]
MRRVLPAALLTLLSATSVHAASGDPFIVGIGRSLNDSTGASTALSWLGVESVRLDVPWAMVEASPGRFAIPPSIETAVNDALAANIEPLLILAYGHPAYGGDKPTAPAAINAFARYATFVVTHFKGRVRLFDLWNEWDARTGGTTPGDADSYVALAKRVYPAIKAANPQAVVLSGGLSATGLQAGWLERFLRQGGLQFVDALSIHPYNFQLRTGNTPESAIAQLERIHALAAPYARNGALKIYVTEMGWPAFNGKGGVSQDTAAEYLTRFLKLASGRQFIAGVWWYCLRDQGTEPGNKEHHFGVMDVSLRPKPAAHALRRFMRRPNPPVIQKSSGG